MVRGKIENRASALLPLFLVEIEQVRGYSPQTVRAYRVDLQQFQAFCGSKFAEKVEKIANARVIGDFLVTRNRAGDSLKTLARRASSVRSFFKYLARDGWLSGDVGDMFPPLKQRKNLPAYISEKIMRDWIEALPDKTIWDNRDRAIIITFYATGARLVEVAGLEWAAVDLVKQQIEVLGKGDKSRIVPIGDFASNALLGYRELLRENFGAESTSGPVFLNRQRGQLSSRSLARILNKRFAPVSGGATVHPHLLRHTFATHLLNRGAGIMAIKELLGHESINTTQIYTHVSSSYLKKTYKQAFPRAEGES